MKTESKQLQDLEREKLVMIKKFIEIRELVDSYNEQEYKVCCEIERLNVEIERVRREKDKARTSQAAVPEPAAKECCADPDCGKKHK